MSDAKLYAPVLTFSTQDKAKLLQQLKSSFKRTINWNKYLPKVKALPQDRYLDYLIVPNCQGVNRWFILSLENEYNREGDSGYYLPKVELKDPNVKIDDRNVFNEPIRNYIKGYDSIDNIKKTTTGQRYDCASGWLPDYPYFKEDYEMISID